MNNDIKTEALLAVADAFYKRGKYLQYDQRSLDRIIQLTPRARIMLPPEAATSQNTTYLDCSTFMNAVFYQTFGKYLESSLTWHMIDMVKPRIFFYEFTHNETDEEFIHIEKEIKNLLKKGDVITYDRYVGSGHTLMYIGDNKYTDCTSYGRPESYDYVNKKSREYPEGGIFIQNLSQLFEKHGNKSIFNEKVKRVAVLRPLDRMDNPTSNALARIGSAKDLFCQVLSSHHGGIHASFTEETVYTVCVENRGKCEKDITIEFNDIKKSVLLKPDEIYEASFTSKNKPSVSVNGLEIYVPEVIRGHKIPHKEINDISSEITEKIKNQSDVLKSVADTYSEHGIEISSDKKELFYNSFILHDSTAGDVLSKNIYDEISLPSYFGGTGVVTPDNTRINGVRCVRIIKSDFMSGDVILVSDSAYGENLYVSFYDGNTFIGNFEANENISVKEGIEADEFIDSLFGRFAFTVIRPMLKNRLNAL